MEKPSKWQYQDTLNLSVDQWCELLKNPSIFDSNVLNMVLFVYKQVNHTSTASAIADGLSSEDNNINYNKITACNKKAAKKIYEYYNVNPPKSSKNNNNRFGNVIFDGNPDCPKDRDGKFYWILRPNLIKAIELLELNH